MAPAGVWNGGRKRGRPQGVSGRGHSDSALRAWKGLALGEEGVERGGLANRDIGGDGLTVV